MKKLLSILLLFVTFGALAQTYDTLPTGSKPYGNFYLGPDGNLVFGNAGLKFRVIGTKKRVDSLLALKANTADIILKNNGEGNNTTLNTPTIVNGTINNAQIGNASPSTARVTDLTTTNNTSFSPGGTIRWEKPELYGKLLGVDGSGYFGAIDISGSYQSRSEKGQPNGYASLDGSGKVPLTQINDALLGAVNYRGTYDAANNSPALPAAASGNKGYYYIISTAGTQFGLTFRVGDWIISNGSAYGKVASSSDVESVNGKKGVVNVNLNDVLIAGNVSEQAMSVGAIAAGSASVTSAPTQPTHIVRLTDLSAYQPISTAVTSVASKTGAVTLNKYDVQLGNVDNTSDVLKPISNPTNAALNLKADKSEIATGQTIGANTTGNATLWGGRQADWNDNSVTSLNSLAALDNNTGKIGRASSNLTKSWLSINDGSLLNNISASTNYWNTIKVTNFNNESGFGILQASGGTIQNQPINGSWGQGIQFSVDNNPDYVNQLVFDLNGGLHKRSKVIGSWYPWEKIATTNDLASETLQTVTDRGNTTTTPLTINSGTNLAGLNVLGTNTGLNWSGRIIAGGINNKFLMGEYNSQAWLGAHNAALNNWADLYVNPDGAKKVFIGNKSSLGLGFPLITADNNTGNVGIGYGATTPGATLDVSGSARVSSNDGSTLAVARNIDLQNKANLSGGNSWTGNGVQNFIGTGDQRSTIQPGIFSNTNTASTAYSALGLYDLTVSAGTNQTSYKNGFINSNVTGTALSFDLPTVSGRLLTGIKTIVTLDFPNVAANQNATLQRTVANVAVNDVVTIGLPNSLMSTMTSWNGDFQVWVSAANTLSFRFQNNDPLAAHDLPDTTFTIFIHKQ